MTIGWWLVALMLAAVFGAAAIALRVGWRLIHPPRKEVDMLPETFGIQQVEEIWFDSRQPVVRLSGWYIRSAANGAADNGHTVIMAHGYSQNRLEPHLPALELAARLVRAGFDVLMFDFRNAGRSGGHVTTVGYWEQSDLLGAVDFAVSHAPGRTVHLLGFSMGAVTSLLAAARDERVASVVADSPFSNLWDYLRENLPRWTGLPAVPFNAVILTLMPLWLGIHPRRVSPLDAVHRVVPRPLLLIHGTADETVPWEESRRLHEAAGHPNAELWLVPDAGHVRSYARRPEEYAERVISFFRRAAGPSAPGADPKAAGSVRTRR